MVSRSTNSFLAASKQSDAQAARQAAESGLNRVMRVLSPFGKNATDPYMSFLLFSVWKDDDGSGKPGWPLAKLGRTAVEDRLRRCRISTRGMQPTQLVPSSTASYDRLMSDVIGTTADGKRTLRYKIVSYTPPARIETSSNPWPTSQCDDFQTVSGGTASITIEGSVELNGKSLSKQRLTRTIELEGVPFPDVPLTMPAPGPPISLRIANQGTGLGDVTSVAYKEFTQDPTAIPFDGTFGQLRPQCQTCSPALFNGVTQLIPLDANGRAQDLPQPFPVPSPTPTYNSYILEPSKPRIIGSNSTECERSPKGTEINCYLQDIIVESSTPFTSPYTPAVGILRVDTSQYPVNLYINGNVGGLKDAPPTAILDTRPTNDPETPTTPNLSLNDGRVVIEHCVKNCRTATPEFYRHDDSSNNYSVRPLWSRLRIFGNPNPSVEQNFLIASRYPGSSSPTSLHGVFLWLPKGKLTYGLPTYTKSSVRWSSPNPESAPTELLATWWIQNLSFDYLTGKMNFIQPLYGNPDAISSILPGSYPTAANGNCTVINGICRSDTGFQEDPRFPVYPVLPRPRNTF
ncbi:MAG: hypothetical protein VKM17_02220 [Cyanobacteriota bacterium]|nr:hypothetical protein [Cyanobacteriota bacterium]